MTICKRTIENLVGMLLHNESCVWSLSYNDKREITETLTSAWDTFKINYEEGSHGEDHIYDVLERSFRITNWVLNRKGTDPFFNMKTLDTTTEHKGFYSLKSIYICMGLAAFTHDIFQKEHREEHHERCGNYIMMLKGRSIQKHPDYTWLNSIEPEDFDIIYTMVREHRASFQGEFSNIMCEIFSAADRDVLILNKVIERSLKHHFSSQKEHTHENKEFKLNGSPVTTDQLIATWKEYDFKEQYINVGYHLIDKFGRDGYAWKGLKSEDEGGIYMGYYGQQLESFWVKIAKMLSFPYKFLEKLENIEKNIKMDGKK